MVEFLVQQVKNICVFCGSGSKTILDFMNNAKDLGKVLGERKICLMFRNNDFGFDGFVAEPTLTSRNQTFPNTYERIF